jgi:hypothetical protein
MTGARRTVSSDWQRHATGVGCDSGERDQGVVHAGNVRGLMPGSGDQESL